MKAFTAQELKQFAPHAREDYIEALVLGWNALQKAEINTPLRLCEFLAQAAHETGGFTIIAEDLTYTAKRLCEVWPDRFKTPLDPRAALCANNPERLAEAVYGGRLGNAEAGDGFRYRGRGFFQDTGRDCYREYSGAAGFDLEANPELLERPDISLRLAIARWRRLSLNRFADRHYIRAIGNAINRGNPYSSRDPIGHQSRVGHFARAWALFGDGGEPKVPPGLALGAHGAKVEALQHRLRELGYGVGAVDRVLGPAMARAIAAFKVDHKHRTGQELEPDEIVGPLTEAAIEAAAPVEVSPDRAAATEHDLAAAGSSEVQTGRQQKAAGWLMLAGSGVEGARQSGGLEMVQEQLGWVPAAHSFFIPVIEAVKWGFSNAFWVVTLVGGVWFWTKGRQVIAARLAAHRKGFNLWR